MKQIYIASIAIILLFAFQSCNNKQKGLNLRSPDKSIQISLQLNDKQELTYTISKNEATVLDSSKLGIKRKDADFRQREDLH